MPTMLTDEYGLSPLGDFVDCLRRGYGAAACARANAARDAKKIVDAVEEYCPSGCEDPIVMIFYYGDPKSKNRPFRRAEYSQACVLSMGLIEAGRTTAANTAVDALGKAAEKAGKKGLSTAASVVSGPIGTMLTAPISLMGVFQQCECDSTRQ